MAKSVILIGYGGHAFVAAEILQESGRIIDGYCDNDEKKLNPYSLTYKGTENQFFLDRNHCNIYDAFVAVGNTALRKKVFEYLYSQNVGITNAIHPNAIVSHKTFIGRGVFIAANAVVNPVCMIGNGVICNTSSSIDHECTIGDFSHICPGTVLCGNVTIGKNSFIGANSTVIPGIKIGDYVTVGAGSTVLHDLLEPGVYIGSPARLFKRVIDKPPR